MDYSDRPTLVGRITDAGFNGGAVFGAAVLGDELFILGFYSEVIKVYDANSFKFKRQLNIPGLYCPGELQSWPERNALFLIDWTDLGTPSKMYIVDRDGNILETWSVGNDFGRLFITNETTLFLTFHDENAIVEFTADGRQISKLKIPLGQHIRGIQHAIKLNDNRFLLSHGDLKNKLHRVCIVDDKGKVLKCFGKERGPGKEQFIRPVYLVVDRNESVLVVDMYNGRVRLLSSELKFQKDLVTKRDGLRCPVKMHLDEDKGLLYVVDNDRIDREMTNGQILIFNVNAQRKASRKNKLSHMCSVKTKTRGKKGSKPGKRDSGEAMVGDAWNWKRKRDKRKPRSVASESYAL